MNAFLENYSQQLLQNKRAIIIGDYNINLLSNDRNTIRYKKLICETGFEILNNQEPSYCTRETSATGSIIDHISTNITKE